MHFLHYICGNLLVEVQEFPLWVEIHHVLVCTNTSADLLQTPDLTWHLRLSSVVNDFEHLTQL